MYETLHTLTGPGLGFTVTMLCGVAFVALAFVVAQIVDDGDARRIDLEDRLVLAQRAEFDPTRPNKPGTPPPPRALPLLEVLATRGEEPGDPGYPPPPPIDFTAPDLTGPDPTVDQEPDEPVEDEPQPEPQPESEVKDQPTVFLELHATGAYPVLDEDVLHSGVTAGFPRLTDAVLAQLDAGATVAEILREQTGAAA